MGNLTNTTCTGINGEEPQTTTYTYDHTGHVTEKLDRNGYEWGIMGEKKSVIYPDGKRAEYIYNEALQMVSLITEGEPINYEYDTVGRLIAKRMSGELLTEYTYNNLGRISDIKHSGIPDKRYSYAYNGLGHRVGQMYVRL